MASRLSTTKLINIMCEESLSIQESLPACPYWRRAKKSLMCFQKEARLNQKFTTNSAIGCFPASATGVNLFRLYFAKSVKDNPMWFVCMHFGILIKMHFGPGFLPNCSAEEYR